MHSFTYIRKHRYITFIKPKEMGVKRCGLLYRHHMECLHSGCAPEVTHTYTATMAFCCYYYYYYYYITIIAITTSHYPLLPHRFCALCFNFPTSPLCCPYFGKRVFLTKPSFRYMRWVVISWHSQAVQPGAHLFQNGSPKEGRLVAKYCSDIYHQSQQTFKIFSPPPFPTCFSTYPD